MTYEQIIALIEKGVTPSQVMQLAGVRDSPDPEPVPEDPPADPEPEQPEEPETPPSDPEPAGKLKVMQLPDLSGLIDSVKTMGQQIEALTRANQEANIKKNIFGEDSPREETADDILAGIIHPPIEKKKED